MDEPGDEAEQDAIVNKVLDEIGIETNTKVRHYSTVLEGVTAHHYKRIDSLNVESVF